jgi:group I intron endonuclease
MVNFMEDIRLINENETEDSIKEERKWCVYMHTNKINNKVYVGITCRSVQERWKGGYRYAEDQPVFHRAIKKYGWDGFEHIIFAEHLTKEEAINMEIALIALYKTNCRRYRNPSYGYNMTDGGEGCSGHVVSEESRKKMSEARKGIVFSEETIQKMREAQLGRKHTDETKKK